MSHRSSPWEIGSAHWDQRDLYTKNARIDDEGYGVGPRVHPELGSYAYTREEGHTADLPQESPEELYAREAWPWKNYEAPPSSRGFQAPEAESTWERLADRVVTALIGEPKESRIARGRSDSTIESEVETVLVRDDALDATDIAVSVKDAHVTLEGTVPDMKSKHRAEHLALAIEGVVEVHNDLSIRDDETPWFLPSRALCGVFG